MQDGGVALLWLPEEKHRGRWAKCTWDPITVVSCGIAGGTQFFPLLLSVVNSLPPRLVSLQVLETYLSMWPRPHYCGVWALGKHAFLWPGQLYIPFYNTIGQWSTKSHPSASPEYLPDGFLPCPSCIMVLPPPMMKINYPCQEGDFPSHLSPWRQGVQGVKEATLTCAQWNSGHIPDKNAPPLGTKSSNSVEPTVEWPGNQYPCELWERMIQC